MKNEYYVYTYTDPRTNIIFYIGKGKKYRDTEHLRCVKNNWLHREPNKAKFNFIKQMLDDGYEPSILRVGQNMSEHEALLLEEQLIHKYKRICDGGTLYNIFNGSVRDEKSRKSISDSLKKYFFENKSPCCGRVASAETRERQSLSKKMLHANGHKVHNAIKYITPYGVFSSSFDKGVSNFGLTRTSLQKRCSLLCDKQITKQSALQIKDFDAIPFIGKTWRELGWYTEKY